MNKLESLYDLAHKEGIIIETIDFNKSDILGVYYKEQGLPPIIGIHTGIDDYSTHKCILAEELGHHYTSNGDITRAKDIRHLKQEKIARRWSYKKLVNLRDIIAAFNSGARNRYEMAEYLRVTENFLEEALSNYREKYGVSCEVDGYIIYFEPNLGVLKRF